MAPNEIFSRKTTNKIFMYLWAPSILQNFQKIEYEPFSGEGAWKMFNVGKKGGTCTLWNFRGEEWPKRGFFRGRGPEDFLKIIFNCWSTADFRVGLIPWRTLWLKSHCQRAIFGYNLRTKFFLSIQFSQNINKP